jgi:hypothetical protein
MTHCSTIIIAFGIFIVPFRKWWLDEFKWLMHYLMSIQEGLINILNKNWKGRILLLTFSFMIWILIVMITKLKQRQVVLFILFVAIYCEF